MADIVNLRQVRKAKTHAEKERNAEANRARFGRSKSDRLKGEMQTELDAKKLNLHKRTTSDPKQPDGGE